MTKRKHSERAAERSGSQSQAELHEQLALLAVQVRSLGERLAGDPSRQTSLHPPADPATGLAELASRSVERVIASAEQAAGEIRARAEREAREIRTRAALGANSGELPEHHRLLLSTLIEDAESVLAQAAALIARAGMLLAAERPLMPRPHDDA